MSKFVIIEEGTVLERETAYIGSIQKRTRPIEYKHTKGNWFSSGAEAVKYKITYYFVAGDKRQEREWEEEDKEILLKTWNGIVEKLNQQTDKQK